MLTGAQKLHDILRSNVLFSVFSRAYEFPRRLKRQNRTGWTFKKEADIFEAVVGGLHLDSANVPGGLIAMQKWFDVLIEPWIDWTLSRMNMNLVSSFMTYNKIPLEPRKPSRALVHVPTGARARSTSPRRKIAPASSSRVVRPRVKPRENPTIGGWHTALGMDDQLRAGAAERRWARIKSLEQYQTFDRQGPGRDRPALGYRIDGQGHDGQGHGMNGQSQGLQDSHSVALIVPEQHLYRAPVYSGDPGYARDRTRLPDLRVRRPPPVPSRPLVDYTDLVDQRQADREQSLD